MDSSFNPAADLLFETRPRKFPWLNIVLFLVTCLTTLVVGSVLTAGYEGGDVAPSWTSFLLGGLPFSIAIMAILFAHEMGHYLTCRYYGIDASLPYFIPVPIPPVGTMGAFIRIRSPIYKRSALLDVGISGPIAGFVVAVVVLVLSIGQSKVLPIADLEAGFEIGEPLIFKATAYLMGKTPPAGMDLFLHPVAFAAWFGFFATAMNLLPVGQLDGGHVTYALFRDGHRWISRMVALAMLPLGFLYWPGWLVWFTLLLIIKLRHPPTIDDSIPLERRHIILGWIGLILFILCFTPMPFHIS